MPTDSTSPFRSPAGGLAAARDDGPGSWRRIASVVSIVAALAALVLINVHPFSSNATPALPVAGTLGGDIHALVAMPKQKDTLFVGGHSGSLVSRDGGRTFTAVAPLVNFDAMAWSVDEDGEHQAVAGHDGLRLSADGGTTWTDITAHLPTTDVHAVGIDPSAPQRIYAMDIGVGLLASADSGASWTVAHDTALGLMGPILVGGRVLRAVDMNAGFVESTDGGITWSARGTGLAPAWLARDPWDPRMLLASGGMIAASSDGGSTWHTMSAPAPIGAAAIAADGTWFAAALQSDGRLQVFESSDRGASWHVPGPAST